MDAQQKLAGGFTSIISSVKERLNLDVAHANTLDVNTDDKLTGNLQPNSPIIDSKAKALHLLDLSRQLNIEPEYAIAVGDGANVRYMKH